LLPMVMGTLLGLASPLLLPLLLLVFRGSVM
jgi:hypothetical protein